MHEILKRLSTSSFVLDLGCASGSFAQENTAATVVRFDREPARSAPRQFVQGDAAKLPFADATFAAVISNHSLEHFEELDGALREIGRVLRSDGALFVAVPDASTFTDKLYRSLAKGGGHVNPFTSARDLAGRIERATGLRHLATRTLYSSLSFLNSRNSPRPRPRRLMLLGGGAEWTLFLYAWFSRRLDRWLGSRISVYGWALYFSRESFPIDTDPWPNVCLRCGGGTPRSMLPKARVYRCPYCGAMNPLAASAGF